jgi:hypothetical protein
LVSVANVVGFRETSVVEEVSIDDASWLVLGAAIAVEDANSAAPKIAGLTTKDFHKILDIFPFLLTPLYG